MATMNRGKHTPEIRIPTSFLRIITSLFTVRSLPRRRRDAWSTKIAMTSRSCVQQLSR
jgi:hypothetical protein